MKPRTALLSAVAALVLLGAVVVPAGAGPRNGAPGVPSNAKLQMYEAVVDAVTANQIVSDGYDVAEIEQLANEQVRLTLVLYPWDRRALEKQGITLTLWRNGSGLTATQLAAQQEAAGYKVWRPYDGPNGLQEYMEDLADSSPLVDIRELGETYGFNADGSAKSPRPIYALKVEKNADTDPDGDDPAVVYSAAQHAREWISVEVDRHLLEWYLKRYREGDPQIRALLSNTELWFLLVANPDGYQYTFEPLGDRLWRKNLRDNDLDGDPTVDPDDGVDPNRNFPEHWGYDDEGSASLPSDDTYRGPSAASEPETQAMMALYEMAHPEFHINYHSYGQLLLYSFGSQVQTPSADDPIFVALSGTDKKPAIQDFNPGVGADLYITNGETTDWAHATQGTLAWTPELSEGSNGDGFIFPDSEGAVNNEFKKNLPFALDVARSAADPDDPKSSLGNKTQPFYLDVSQIDPQKAHNPLSDFTFDYSYGDPQPVEILAKRDLDNDGVTNDAVTVHWRVNGGSEQTAPTTEWNGGDRFGEEGDAYYRIVRGEVKDFAPGDHVQVWFTGGGKTSASFTFEAVEEVVNETPADIPDVLILAAEDYSGPTNVPAYPAGSGPHWLHYYEDALADAGYTTDVYDVDAMGRIAPDHLGVLSHYDAVVWYTGNDLLTREPGQVPGTGASTLANAEVLEVRSYLNEGGKLLYTGVNAGWQYYNGYPYNPVSTPPFCDGTVNNKYAVECLALSDDFFQYYLGAYLFIEEGGTDRGSDPSNVDDEPFPIDGVGALGGNSWDLIDGTGAGNHLPNASRGTTFSLLTTSSLLPTSTYPQFTSAGHAVWNTGLSGAFSPHGNSTYYAYSDRGDVSYKRLQSEIVVPSEPSTDQELSFFISYDTEVDWDYVFVELTDAAGNRVTLPELDGHTSHGTGESCPEGWFELHPSLELYQGADCAGAGWNAATGRSAGWEEWAFDLSPWEGETVTVSISYASDWATQGLGVFVDDINAPGISLDTGFESGALGGWTVPGAPAGSDANPNDFAVRTDVGFVEAAAVGMTPSDADFRTLYLAFGFEGISDGADRDAVMADAMDYLLGP